jgi:hypothetical protein
MGGRFWLLAATLRIELGVCGVRREKQHGDRPDPGSEAEAHYE